MEDHLEALRQKQKKLTFLFGELVYGLCRSDDARFRPIAENKEAKKFLDLLDYLADRIDKIEALYSVELEAEAQAEEDEAAGMAQPEAEPVAEDVPEAEGSFEEAAVEEEAAAAQEAITAEAPVEVAVPQEEAEAEPLPSVDDVPAEDEEPQITEAVEDEVNLIVAEENPSRSSLSRQRSEAADTLAEILETAKFSSSANRRLFEKNIKQLRMGTELEREISVAQIAHITPKAALHRVYEIAMRDESPLVRLTVIKNISRMKEGDAEGFFDLGINDPDPKVRAAAIKGLGSRVCEKHRKLLEGLLKDDDVHVRGLAVTYLGIYYGKDGVKKAMTSWTDDSPYVRASLLEMLSIVKPDGVLTIVKDLLSDPDQEVKKAAEKALEKLMPERTKGKANGKRKK